MNSTADEANQEECVVFYERHPDLSNNVYMMSLFAFIYVTIFILGIAGNAAIIYVTLRNKTLQTVQNLFILNLAVSDVIVCLLSLPITPVTNIYKNWYFGFMMCRMIPCVQGVSIFICTFSLGAIAVDRYILVVRPHSPPLTKRGALVVTAVLWSVSIIVSCPYGYNMYEESYEGVCGRFCTERWPSALARRAYTMMVMVAQFVVPFTLMAFCYATIFSKLRGRAKMRLRKIDARSMAMENSTHNTRMYERDNCTNDTNGTNASNGHDDQMCLFFDKQEKERQRLLAQMRRTTNILVAMVVMFGLTWLPHNVVSIIIEYDEEQNFFHLFGRPDWDISYLVNLFTHSFAMTNNVTNPVLYAWLNPTFREYVVRTFFGRRKDTNPRVISKNAHLRAVDPKREGPARKRSATLVEKTQSSKRVTKTHRSKRSSLPMEKRNSAFLTQPPPAYESIEFSENDTFV